MTAELGHVVVTGGAGFIGSHLVNHIVGATGTRVTVIDDMSTGHRGNLETVGDDIELIEGDCADPAVAAAAADADIVFHLAVRNVRASISRPRENLRVNAVGTLEVLDAVRRGRRGLFIYISSSEIYGQAPAGVFSEDVLPQPTTVYGAGKLAGEHLTLAYHRTYGLDTMVIRPFNNFGPRSHFEGDSGEVIPKFILRALAGEPLNIHGDGTQTRDFMYVEDTAAWLLELSRVRDLIGDTVNIGYGREVTVNELAHHVVELTGSVSPVVRGPERPGDLPRLLADTSKVSRLTEYRPSVGLEDGLQRTIEYFRALGDPHELLVDESEETWL